MYFFVPLFAYHPAISVTAGVRSGMATGTRATKQQEELQQMATILTVLQQMATILTVLQEQGQCQG